MNYDNKRIWDKLLIILLNIFLFEFSYCYVSGLCINITPKINYWILGSGIWIPQAQNLSGP